MESPARLGPVHSGSSGPALVCAASILLACILFLPVAEAASRSDIDWDARAASVIEEWEHWRERYFSPGETAPFEPVAKAYSDVFAPFSSKPIAQIATRGLQAELKVLNSLSFHLVSLKEAERGGFSLAEAYRRGQAIWGELKRRGDSDPQYAEWLVEMAVGVRDFAFALHLAETAGLTLNLPSGLSASSLGDEGGDYPVWRLDGQERLEMANFAFPEGLHWVVVGTEGCGFCQLFLADVAEEEELTFVRNRINWLVPPGPYLDMELVDRARANGAVISPLFMHTVDDWPMFDKMFQSPIIYLMRDDRVLDRVVGWPRDGSHISRLVELWTTYGVESD